MPNGELKELQQIKGLLIVLLMKLGATSEELGLTLGVHPSRVRQLVPPKKIKQLERFS